MFEMIFGVRGGELWVGDLNMRQDRTNRRHNEAMDWAFSSPKWEDSLVEILSVERRVP